MIADIQVMDRDIEEEKHSVAFALVDGAVIGTLAVYRFVPGMEERPFVFDFFISAKYRGRGFGLAMANAMKDYLSDQGINVAYMHHVLRVDVETRSKSFFNDRLGVSIEFVRYEPNRGINIFRLKWGG